ncbi:MAG: hypothetical protein IPP29_15950 [Bacteroidetes bacterium]|nr:hypothetical protein [Bacteroidota bacterium]
MVVKQYTTSGGVSNTLAQTNNYFEDNTTGIKTVCKIIPITSNNCTFIIWNETHRKQLESKSIIIQ